MKLNKMTIFRFFAFAIYYLLDTDLVIYTCKEPLKGGFVAFKVCVLLRVFVKIHGDPYYEHTMILTW